MADIRAFFSPVAAAASPADHKRSVGRPQGGVGSQGGAGGRDAASRVLPRKRSAAAAHADDTDDSSGVLDPPPISKQKRRCQRRTNWSVGEAHHQLQRAVELVQRKGHSVLSAATITGVPRTVIGRRIHGQVSEAAQVGATPALSAAQEQQLVSFLLQMAERGFGKDVIEIRALARRLSASPNFKATTRWWYRFQKRHPELARRRTQGFERLRASAMNSGLIKHYFLLLSSAFAKIAELSGGMPLTVTRIHNMDEIGFMLNAVKPYIVTLKGTKHAASVSYNCRVTTSVAVCVSASGYALPPFFIVKGLRRPADYLAAAPPGSAFAMAKKGMMTEVVFSQWVDHFVQHMEKREPTHWSLLLLDGHHSHTMNPNVLKQLWEARVYVVSLPSHTTAALQLLDVAVFGPLKRAFRDFIHEWKEANPNEVLDKRAMPNIISGVWKRAMLPNTIVKGAASTGLWPLNVNWTAQNAAKLKISQTFHQQTLPGSISFAAFSSSQRSLAALNLMLSPEQTTSLLQRIHVAGQLPKLNVLGESASAARLLNSEQRVQRLFALHDQKMADLARRLEAKKQRGEKRDARRAAQLQKRHSQDVRRTEELPLVEVLVEAGFQEKAAVKPTLSVMKAFAAKQGIRVKGGRAAIVTTLLKAIQDAGAARQWRSTDAADSEAEEKQQDESDADSAPSASEHDTNSEDSGLEDWSDTKILF